MFTGDLVDGNGVVKALPGFFQSSFAPVSQKVLP